MCFQVAFFRHQGCHIQAKERSYIQTSKGGGGYAQISEEAKRHSTRPSNIIVQISLLAYICEWNHSRRGLKKIEDMKH